MKLVVANCGDDPRDVLIESFEADGARWDLNHPRRGNAKLRRGLGFRGRVLLRVHSV